MDALYMLAFLLAVNAILFYCSTIKARTRKVRSEKLRKDISELRVQAKRLESPATFAKSAKLDRQANVKERELAAVQVVSPSEAEFVKGINTVKYIVCATLLYQWWGLPVLFVPSLKLGFMAERVQLPHGWGPLDGEAQVSVLSWLFICDTASNALIAAIDAQADW